MTSAVKKFPTVLSLKLINESIHNYINKKLVRFGWGAYFGKSSYAGLFKKKCKRWGLQRVHPKIKLMGKKGYILNV